MSRSAFSHVGIQKRRVQSEGFRTVTQAFFHGQLAILLRNPLSGRLLDTLDHFD